MKSLKKKLVRERVFATLDFLNSLNGKVRISLVNTSFLALCRRRGKGNKGTQVTGGAATK